MDADPPARRRRAGTVRFRLTAFATAAVATVLLASSVAIALQQREMLIQALDETLRQRADDLTESVAVWTEGTRLPVMGEADDSFVQLVTSDGRVMAASVNVTGMPAALVTQDEGEALHTVHGVPLGGGAFRVLTTGVGDPKAARTLVVAKNLDDVDENVRILTGSLMISVPLVLALLALLVWWLTGRVLRPVESVRAEVASIRGHELHRRVRVPGAEDEISRLAETMNAMLDRVEQSAVRERTFVADASHELRGPLTRLRSELEVALRHPGQADPHTLAGDLLDDVVDLQHLVDDLLYLARSDAGVLSVPDTPVDLDDLVLVEAGRLRERGRVEVITSDVGAARVMGDARQLARAVGNLADNAERHARNRIAFSVRERDGRSEIVITDDGPGVPPEQRERIFERFTRLDQARSSETGGAGLGLAIVRDIVERHRGTVSLDGAAPGGTRVSISLPRAD